MLRGRVTRYRGARSGEAGRYDSGHAILGKAGSLVREDVDVESLLEEVRADMHELFRNMGIRLSCRCQRKSTLASWIGSGCAKSC